MALENGSTNALPLARFSADTASNRDPSSLPPNAFGRKGAKLQPRAKPDQVASVPRKQKLGSRAAAAFFWIVRIQPQGRDYDYGELAYRWYEAARRLGLDVDFVAPGADLGGYRLVLVPSLPHVTEAALQALRNTDAAIVFGSRSGSKTRHFSIPDSLPPGPLADLMPFRVVEVASLRPGLAEPVTGAVDGVVTRWREHIAPGAGVDVEATFPTARPPSSAQAGTPISAAGATRT